MKTAESFLRRALSRDAERMSGALTRPHVVEAPAGHGLPEVVRIATDGHRMHVAGVLEDAVVERDHLARGLISPLGPALDSAKVAVDLAPHCRTASQIRAACDRAEALAETRWHRACADAIDKALANGELPKRDAMPAKSPSVVYIGGVAVNASYLRDALVGMPKHAAPTFRTGRGKLDPVVVERTGTPARELAVIMPMREEGEWPEIASMESP